MQSAVHTLEFSYLFLLHRLQDLDDAPLLVLYIDALKNLAVLAPPDFPYDLVVVLVPDSVTRFSGADCKL